MRSLLIILIAATIVSCNKELPDEFTPYAPSAQADTTWKVNVSPATVNDLFDMFTDHVSIQGFYAENGGSFSLNDSLQIEIPSDALLLNGAPVKGLVSVNISQYRTKGQMIANKISTIDNSQVLESIGAFNVKFYRNSDTLALAPGKKYTLKVKQLSNSLLQSLNIFYGAVSPLNFHSFWTATNDGSQAITVSSGQGTPGYYLQLANTGWISAAKPADITGAEKIRVNMIMPPAYTNANTFAFLVLKEQNAVVRLKPDVDSKSFYAENIPAGKSIKIVTVSRLNDQYYFGSADATATKGAVVKVTPQKMSSKSDIISTILNL